MTVKEFENLIKKERQKLPTAFDLAFSEFAQLGYNKQPREFFFENASEILTKLRRECWNHYTQLEKEFTSKMLERLIDIKKINTLSKEDAIKDYIHTNGEYIYKLNLSNTNSRRARAGREFEAIIELLLVGAEIGFTSQGVVGSGVFKEKSLAKLVDLVVPGVEEYTLDKRNTSLISAKTTLRERWQEVGDEMARTSAREIYLATIDDSVSDNVVNLLKQNNIILVVPKKTKINKYVNKPSVISFEDMLEELYKQKNKWSNKTFTKAYIKVKYNEYDLLINQSQNDYIKQHHTNKRDEFMSTVSKNMSKQA